MALSDLRVGTSLPGGHLNTLGGPADPFYAQTDGTSWPSLSAACAAVPAAYRKNRTVNVLGQEYWWLEADLSDNGLVLKTAASSGGGSLVTYPFSISVQQNGAQPFPARAGMDGVLDVVIQTTYGVTRSPLPSHYRLSGNTLVFDEGAALQDGETIEGRYYAGGGSGSPAASRDPNDVPEAVCAAVRAVGHDWDYGDLFAYATPAHETAALDGVQKGDYFDDFEEGSTVDNYRYTYCKQSNRQLGWTRIPKLS